MVFARLAIIDRGIADACTAANYGSIQAAAEFRVDDSRRLKPALTSNGLPQGSPGVSIRSKGLKGASKHERTRPAASRIDLVNDLDHAMRPRIDQHGLVVHNGVSMVRRTIFGRHLVVGEAAIRQDDANMHRFTIMK